MQAFFTVNICGVYNSTSFCLYSNESQRQLMYITNAQCYVQHIQYIQIFYAWKWYWNNYHILEMLFLSNFRCPSTECIFSPAYNTSAYKDAHAYSILCSHAYMEYVVAKSVKPDAIAHFSNSCSLNIYNICT